jgi:hypothetical protein
VKILVEWRAGEEEGEGVRRETLRIRISRLYDIEQLLVDELHRVMKEEGVRCSRPHPFWSI